ncbi:MAG TPA: hypothetical protein VM694_08905 [Polyangium sp.]|nr:hypothetical protein [Polyangium sp.]
MGATTAALDGDDAYAPMFVPVIGPFITLDSASNKLGGLTLLCLFDGLTQLAGAAMIVVGVAVKKDILLRDDLVEKKSVLAPEFLFGPGSAGVRLRF